ncbi:MAG TPA: hypothetical protein VG168_09185 [Bryobacteraceae bacterium]|nr:hypothetical protein [Bryobacteraceae bacterium]
MTPIFQLTALLLIPLLLRVPLSAQSIAQDAPSLRMRALPQSNQSTLAVEVTDAQGAPVPDVAVTFRMPEDGPAGVFADGSGIAVVTTDTSGRAQVTGLRWTAAGAASVRVTATKGTEHAGILLERQAETKPEPAAVPMPAIKSTPAPAPPITAAVSKPTVVIQPPSPQLKPAQGVAAATTPPVKAISPKPAPQEVAAIPPSPAMTAPAIEPPHVSITSVSRKQAVPGQVSSASPASSVEPSVAITGAGQRNHGGSKKWIILAVIAAGAGAGAAVMLSRGKSTPASTASTSAVSIGAPTVSIGAP